MNDGGYMAVSPLNSDIVFCVGNVYNSGYFLAVSHTSDGGTTWEHDTLSQLGSRAWAVAFDPVDPNRVYVGGDSAYSYAALIISTDCGVTWTPSHTGLVGAVNALVTDPSDAQLLYAGTYNGVFKSTNAGATWSATSLTQQTRTLVLDPEHTECLYAGTYGSGAYASTDYGATWTAINTGLTCNKILSLALRSGSEVTLYAGTEGGSVFRSSEATGIWAGPSPLAPRPSLDIFPNPCHATTAISFCAPLNTATSLTIYDASGRVVKSCNLRSSPFVLQTSQLTPGAYFVRLSTGSETRAARLTVLK